jgi:hypothetical protein
LTTPAAEPVDQLRWPAFVRTVRRLLQLPAVSPN